MDGRELYEDVCDDTLAGRAEVERVQMMGMPCVQARGRLVAGFDAAEDAMVFKLVDATAHAEALTLEGARPFDPSRQGRSTRWVLVPPRHADRWRVLLERALPA